MNVVQRAALFGAAIAIGMATSPTALAQDEQIRVGSKSFTESVILGEIATAIARAEQHSVEHTRGLGGTRLLWEALLSNQLDIYPDYTGTIRGEILAAENLPDDAALRKKLRELGLRLSAPLGFNNTYALGMRADVADRLGIRAISDLRDHPELTIRFSNEFMNRADGWPSLSRAYRLPQRDVRGIEHALAYEALDSGAIDVTDLYATDAKIQKFHLRVLADDLAHFPAYDAVFVYRADLAERAPRFVDALDALAGAIDAQKMIALNAAVDLDRKDEGAVGTAFVNELLDLRLTTRAQSYWGAIWRYGREHLWMVTLSMITAILASIPLGVVAARNETVAQVVLAVVGIIQTVPSIALLVLLIAPIGALARGLGMRETLGFPQAVVALFLYSLLPIVRNTYTGLRNIPGPTRDSAIALGLSRFRRLWHIELPLASRTILAGVKTAAVINIGFATLGGFIGAGGFGDAIFTGIRRDDTAMVIWQGAVPAALLAIAAQLLFEVIERVIVPRGLRIAARSAD